MSNKFVNYKNILEIKAAYESGFSSGNFYPSVFVLEPISHCNLSCVMCPNSKLHSDKLGYMEVENFKLIISKIKPYAELTMLYFMGEPLQHPSFIDLVKLARSTLNGRIVISTNCMLLTAEISKELIDCGIDIIICCIDHWTKKKYEKIRIGGNFETVVSNVETLLKIKSNKQNLKTNVIVKSLDFGFQEDEMQEFISHWKNLGGIPLIGWLDSWAGQLYELRKLDSQPQPYAATQRVACADLWFKMVINWKGEVVLCCHNYDYSIVFGNLITTDLLEIWNCDSVVSYRNSHLQKNFNCNKLCAGCTEWGALTELDTYVNLIIENLSLVF